MELHAENIRLEGEIQKANETIELLKQDVQIEHEEGFNKVVCQASYLLGVDPLSSGFDIVQDVYDGKMMPVVVRGEEERPAKENVAAEDASEGSPVRDVSGGEDDGVGGGQED